MTTEFKHEKGWRQGLYTLKNPDKYLGNKNYIRFMSSWEKRMHEFLDSNPNVLAWCSEPLAIPYIKPTDGLKHNYIPDYYVEYQDADGNIKRKILEVKPRAQRVLKEGMSKLDVINFHINQAKWTYAKAWCDAHGLEFEVISETQDASNKRSFRKRKLKKLRAR